MAISYVEMVSVMVWTGSARYNVVRICISSLCNM